MLGDSIVRYGVCCVWCGVLLKSSTLRPGFRKCRCQRFRSPGTCKRASGSQQKRFGFTKKPAQCKQGLIVPKVLFLPYLLKSINPILRRTQAQFTLRFLYRQITSKQTQIKMQVCKVMIDAQHTHIHTHCCQIYFLAASSSSTV